MITSDNQECAIHSSLAFVKENCNAATHNSMGYAGNEVLSFNEAFTLDLGVDLAHPSLQKRISD